MVGHFVTSVLEDRRRKLTTGEYRDDPLVQQATLGKRPMPSSWPRVVRIATLIAWTPTAMACPARTCRVPHRSGIRLVVTPLANAGIESTRYGEYNAEYPAAPYS